MREGVMKCRLCGVEISTQDNFKHRKEAHPQEYAAEREKVGNVLIRKGRERRRQKRAASLAAKAQGAATSATPTTKTESPGSALPQESSELVPPGATLDSTPAPVGSQQTPPASVLENEPLEEVPEAKPSRNGKTKEPAGSTARLQFVARTIQVDARVLLFYNLSRQRFPEYVATEGEWLLDVVTRYYAEHAEDFGLDMSTMLQEVQAALLLEEE